MKRSEQIDANDYGTGNSSHPIECPEDLRTYGYAAVNPLPEMVLYGTTTELEMEETVNYAEFFYEIKGKFMGADVSDIHEHLAFQFNIEDQEAGGAFYVEVKNGELFVEPYEYYDRDAIFICAPAVLLDIADGSLDPIAAFTDQKLRVEGSFEKALRLKEIIDMKKGSAQEDKSIVKKAADKVVNTIVQTAARKIDNQKD